MGYSDNSITHHADFENLKSEIGRLRASLSTLVLTRDTLLHRECKAIETAYILSFGALEYKIHETECAILRLKRKAELIQAQKNRQKEPDLAEVEKILDAEFAEYQEQLNDRIAKINDAITRKKGSLMTGEEFHEFKQLYHSVVKALHPDLNPGLDIEKIHLYHNAVKAYKNGDIESLRLIATMIAAPAIPAAQTGALAVLTNEKERLKQLLQNIKDDIARIKSEYPFTMKPLIHDGEKTSARKTGLEERIKQLNEIAAAYTARIAEITA